MSLTLVLNLLLAIVPFVSISLADPQQPTVTTLASTLTIQCQPSQKAGTEVCNQKIDIAGVQQNYWGMCPVDGGQAVAFLLAKGDTRCDTVTAASTPRSTSTSVALVSTAASTPRSTSTSVALVSKSTETASPKQPTVTEPAINLTKSVGDWGKQSTSEHTQKSSTVDIRTAAAAG